ncbi:MAG TPA: glycosyltransferase [Phycisphaerae bacterium]|nr:glycosyltransferase [Phycisphaerae bacterium]
MSLADPHIALNSPQPAPRALNIVIIGLAITSSWGNGHATTYRGLVRELTRRGHNLLFLECDRPWYAHNRDMPRPPFGRTELYDSLHDLQLRFLPDIAAADLVIVGSYVQEGVPLGEWVTALLQRSPGLSAFYDIDTPVTLAKLHRHDYEYLAPHLIPRYDLYLSFTGGPTLRLLEQRFGSPRALPLYCSVDPELYFPEPRPFDFDLGYLGTYSPDRQPTLHRLLLQPARRLLHQRFVVAGPQYPDTIPWPANLRRVSHLAPADHRAFYNAQRFTLNVTRHDMIKAGYSPSVRLFEAAACGVPIISDSWDGLETLLKPGQEILLAQTSADVIAILRDLPEESRRAIAENARRAVLARHTAAHRARELEGYILTHAR